jgi:hypothetical protein
MAMKLEDARKAIVKYVKDELDPKKKLNFRHKLDRHRGFFAWRRATTIGGLPSNAPLLADPDLKFFKERIALEYKQLDAFLETKVLTLDPFGPDKPPKHLDLHDLAKPKLTTASHVVRENEARYRALRRYRIRAIGWRAAAIHDEVWKASANGRSAILLTDALDMLIDRRLHIVERMNFQISRADVLGGAWSFTAPWEDGFRVRMFEYPRIPKKQVKQAEKFIDPDEIGPPGTKPFQPGAGLWRRESPNGRLIFNRPPYPGLNLPPQWVVDTARVQSSTTQADKLFWAYFRLIDQNSKATDVLDAMFKPETNWTTRNWLFCDHVISALHLEALLFAWRRRDPSNADQKFNALMGAPTGPLSIGGFLDRVGASNAYGRLLSMANDPHFENIAIDESDLQVGDHVVVYNSKVFGALSPSEWVLENSVVIDVDSDHSRGMAPTSGNTRTTWSRTLPARSTSS